ncbi:MAG: metallophosphoesterase [Bacteroidetes bacterium]|nr:metallophosphoesterase [Bacteroidota bacterium]
MRKLFVLPAILLILLVAGCKKKSNDSPTADSAYHIIVMSDNHYMDPSLLIKDGPKFQTYLIDNGKLLVASDAIMREFIGEVLNSNPRPDLVLIPGDLTKDGELVSHLSVHLYLEQLIQAGIKVRVIDGNHDIYNPNSYVYDDSTYTRVPNIGPNEFRSIYSDCGYSDAIATDPYSLSYVSEPLPNLWLIVIDACKYDYSVDKPYTNGAIRPNTMTWIKAQLTEAAKRGKTVFGMMHHAIVEHFQAEDTLFNGFLIDHWANEATQLMNAGLKIMFTGHFHASDISEATGDGKFLYDINTGSIVVYPCSYRRITYIKDSELIITTDTIKTPDFTLSHMDPTFSDYARRLTQRAGDTMFTSMLYYRYNLYKDSIPLEAAWRIGQRMSKALMGNLAGDESEPQTESDSILKVNNRWKIWSDSAQLNFFTYCLWNDLRPQDNTLTIDLKSGNSH